MKVLVCACIIAVFCVAVSLQDTPHTPCADGPLPKKLRVEGCDSSPCNMYRGTNLLAHWDFAANANANELKPRVRVKALGATIEYPYPEQDACKSLTNGGCPLVKGNEVTYNLKMPISPNYPLIRVNIEFALIDENKNVQVCFKIDGKVANKKDIYSSFIIEKA